MKKVKQFDYDYKNVTQAYSGELKACMCGCSGKYYFPSDKSEEYDSQVGEIVPRTVKMIFNKIRKAVLNGNDVKKEGSFLTMDTDTRTYQIWFNHQT